MAICMVRGDRAYPGNRLESGHRATPQMAHHSSF